VAKQELERKLQAAARAPWTWRGACSCPRQQLSADKVREGDGAAGDNLQAGAEKELEGRPWQLEEEGGEALSCTALLTRTVVMQGLGDHTGLVRLNSSE